VNCIATAQMPKYTLPSVLTTNGERKNEIPTLMARPTQLLAMLRVTLLMRVTRSFVCRLERSH
jgi:hypothetical protein